MKHHRGHTSDMAATGDGGSSKWKPPPKPKQSLGDGGSSKWRPPSKRDLGFVEDFLNIN